MTAPTTTQVQDDEALSTLCSIFPSLPPTRLSRILIASNNNLQRATTALLNSPLQDNNDDSEVIITATSNPRKRPTSERKLDDWLSRPSKTHSSNSSNASTRPTPRPPPAPTQPTRSAFAVLRDPFTTATISSSSSSSSTPTPPTAPQPPLLLTTPAMIAQHTSNLLTIVHDVLPRELAERLFDRMVQESEGRGESEGKGAWERNRWYMFDREVESPHTTSFYVEELKEGEHPSETESGGGKYGQRAFAEAATHWYNGERKPSRTFLPEMNDAREVIGSLVRTVLSAREKHPLEWTGEWRPNVSAANCYRGSKESVGYHSDVLTYLGPYPTIASLSLGVTRPFRLRPFGTGGRTLEVRLPHNSLCIMHAGCQERFKHSVPTVGAVDLWKGRKERINMTFRHFRPDFSPLPDPSTSYHGTPICPCGTPTTLRPDGRGRARASLSTTSTTPAPATTPQSSTTRGRDEEKEMIFFWTCSHGQQNEGKGCKFWKKLDMKGEGRGEWFGVRKES